VAEGASGQPSEAEVAARLEEELKRLRVSDLLVQTLYTVSSLGYQKLAGEHRDLPQARLAIEALRALLPVLEGEVPEEVRRDFGQVVANMQLAYADAVREAPPAKSEEPGTEEAQPEEAKPEEAVEPPQPEPEDLEPVDGEEHGGGG
jgi:hypothetical protein